MAPDRLGLKVAVFVKTPRLSPVKTRLAESLGAVAAREFFWLASAAVAAILKDTQLVMGGHFLPHWAVAEAAGVDDWSGFPCLAQGEGPLGARLDLVYRRLGAGAVLIGGDAPQIDTDLFLTVHAQLVNADFVIGPARDGGFYLVAGRLPIPRELWTSIVYSDSKTSSMLARALGQLGAVSYLQPLTDVDYAADLVSLQMELARLPRLVPEQDKLLRWLRQVTTSFAR